MRFSSHDLADYRIRRRAIATAEIFGTAILSNQQTAEGESPHRLIIRKDLLDDSNAAKEPQDKVKKRLKVLLRPGEYKRPEFAFAWRVPDVEPQQVVQETVELLRYHRDGKTFSISYERCSDGSAQSCERIGAKWMSRPFSRGGAVPNTRHSGENDGTRSLSSSAMSSLKSSTLRAFLSFTIQSSMMHYTTRLSWRQSSRRKASRRTQVPTRLARNLLRS